MNKVPILGKRKLLLLHGVAISSSRKKLLDIKREFDESNVIVFDEQSNVQEILGSLMTPSLLSEDQLFILENPPEDFIPYTLYPIPSDEAASSAYTLIFWFNHEVSEKKPIMEYVKKEKGQILYFPEGKEVSVFPFLDFLAAGKIEAFLEVNKLKKAGFDVFYLIVMTFYLLRNLVNIPKSAPQFVRQRKERQRKNFDLEKIKSLYKETLEIDFKLKSGLMDITQAEFSLVNLFLH